MKKYSIITILISLIISISLYAKEWISDGGGYSAYATEVVTTENGNVYVFGSFRSSFKVYGKTIVSKKYDHMYLIKYNK